MRVRVQVAGEWRQGQPLRLFFLPATTIMDVKLKSLKVVDLKEILQKANVAIPTKANKQDLIAKIVASPVAIDVYNKLHNPTAADDLVCASFKRDMHMFIVCLAGSSRRVSPLRNKCLLWLTNSCTVSIGKLTRARFLRHPRQNH